jgi:hypothetical protein
LVVLLEGEFCSNLPLVYVSGTLGQRPEGGP